MKLELAILAGAESKAFLASFTKQIDRLEALLAKTGGAATATDNTDEEGEESDFETETAPAKTDKKGKAGKATAKAFDEDDEPEASSFEETEESETEEESDEDFTAPAPAAAKGKKTAAPKYTTDDVNDACKAKAQSIGGKKGREAVFDILKKKFKVNSVTDLKPEQYADAIKAMKV